jgi:hypothetical protein
MYGWTMSQTQPVLLCCSTVTLGVDHITTVDTKPCMDEYVKFGSVLLEQGTVAWWADCGWHRLASRRS